MAAITKLPEPLEIMTLDDLKKVNISKDARLVMLAVTPAELNQIMKWVDAGWRSVLRNRKYYDRKRGGVTDPQPQAEQPKLKIMAIT